MNKDSIYVLKQPSHAIVTLVVAEGDQLPLSERVHNNLNQLSKISDLVFIFSDKFTNNVDISKFTNLYYGSAYICGSDEVISKPLVNVFNYCINIFKSHSVYLLTSISHLNEVDCDKLNDESLEKIQEISASGIKRPIFSKNRLSYEELAEIYMLPDKSNTVTDFIKELFSKNKSIRHLDNNRMYSTMNTSTPIILLKKSIIELFINLMPKEEGYLESFVERDYTYFIASLIDKLGLDNINGDILTLKVGELRNE